MEWNFDPVIFNLDLSFIIPILQFFGFGGDSFVLSPRYYSLMFIGGFFIGLKYCHSYLREAGKTDEEVEAGFWRLIVGTLVGARLGHCLFYDPIFYLSNPQEILYMWNGGLASHGGFLGILIATFMYLRTVGGLSFLWLADLVAAPALLTGSFIRIGNLLNSEIIGRPTDVPWAFVFKRVDDVPRHPSQLYESAGYFVIAMALFFFNKNYREKWPLGRVLGITFVFGWAWRIFVEFFKENQEAFEQGLVLNMGQLLSVPFILFGLYLISGKIHQNSFFNFMTKPFPVKNSASATLNKSSTAKKTATTVTKPKKKKK
ncbi:MAG: prolipoprotein diacylglyceryl transferase [Oligoflexales bacterium]|nr:prolipoprotein diacylglyceryl transferase [Oligoflexales bacterium]